MLRLAVPLILAAGVASAQAPCMPRTELVEGLSRQYGETPIAMGMVDNVVMEIFVSPKTRTWTAVYTSADGTSCAVAAGSDWTQAAPVGDPS